MNPFIRGKFVKVVLLGVAIIISATAFISYQQYLNLKGNMVQNAFDDEKLFVEKLENHLESSKSILISAAKVTVTELYSQSEMNGAKPEDYIQNSLYGFRSVNNSDKKHLGLRQPNLYIQVLEILNKSGNFNELGLIAKVGAEKYQIVDVKDARLSIALLDWLNDLPDMSSRKPDIEEVLFPPPFVEQGELINYLVIQLPVPNAAPLFLVARLNNELLQSELNSTYIIWQSNNKRVVSSNMNVVDSLSNTNQNALVTRFLPSQWHKFILDGNNIIEPTVVLSHHNLDWLIQLETIKAAPLQILLFKEAKIALDGIRQATAQKALQLIGIGVFGFLVLLLFLYLALIKPISDFLSFIEKQNSFYEASSIEAPKGWEVWFEKIRNSFKENRNLFNALVQKNQLLDEKIQRRTQELRRQTKSKDRNLALNRAIINSLPDMIYYKNIDGSYVGCNNAFENFCGFSEGEIVTKLSEEIFSSETAEQLAQFDIHALQSNRLFSGKIWHQLIEKSIFINWLVAPIVNSEGELLGTVGLGRDITQGELALKEIEDAKNTAEEANRIKSEFIANMSHEIRTPITAITGMLDLLESTSPSPLQQSYLDVASSSSNHLLQVINDILDFSRINAGMMELLEVPFELDEVFSIAFANSLPTAMEKDLLLDVDLPLDFPTRFIGDKIRLSQVLTNLINNAVKFTDRGSITLRARTIQKTENQMTIDFSVTDTGRGIPVEKQESIFNAFSQADSSITRRFGGTGLGLAIVFQIIEMMGGRILVDSEVGRGTTFTASLRLTIDPNSKATVNVDAKPADAHKRQWVIFESHRERAELLLNKLKRIGQNVLVNTWDVEESAEIIVVISPQAFDSLPKKVIDKIVSNEWRLQPVVFDVNDIQDSKLQGIPCLPILSMPINDQHLIANLNSELVTREFLKKDKKVAVDPERLLNLHVLLVEDNEVNQQVISLMLASEGITCDIADNGQEGLLKLASQTYDAVVLDIQMPVMDGLTMSKQIRATEALKDLPLLAMTAHTNEESKLRSKEVGIDMHLNKPINKSLMVDTLHRLVLDKRSTVDDPIDIKDLLAQVGNSNEILSRLVSVFLDTKSEELMDFIQNFDSYSEKEVTDKLHNFEGMLGNIRANQAVQSVRMLRAAFVKKGNEVGHELTDLKTNLIKLFGRLNELK